MLDNILQVILTKLNRALIKHFSLRLMVNVSDMVQECPTLMRKTLINMSNVVKKTFREHFNRDEIIFVEHDDEAIWLISFMV